MGRPANFRSRLAHEIVPGSLSFQRKHGALRIDAPGDPRPVLDFKGALEDPATKAFHVLRRDIDVVNVEIVEPEGEWLALAFAEHAADGPATGRKQLIGLDRV